jgi:hypothetical protein
MPCDDPDCIGCKFEGAIAEAKADGWMPEMVIECFFDYLKEAYAEEADVSIALTEVEPRSIH